MHDHRTSRDDVFTRIADVFETTHLAGAFRCAARLQSELPHPRELDRNTVLVAYGGGKDSSYMLTFVRVVQLLLGRVYGSTFRMRVVTNRHAGMPRAVMENIDRAYRALGLYADPACELLLADGDELRPFDVDLPHHPDIVRRNRTDILMTGHRTGGDARPTFCNACNLSMVNSFGIAAAYRGGVDLVVTGDSEAEQRAYYLWVRRLARRLGHRPGRSRGFQGFLAAANAIAVEYFRGIHGAESDEHRVAAEVNERLRFFSIYDDTEYASGAHWKTLADLLGFEFDELAFSFTESDCGNPGLMAHLRGLKSERVYGRAYRDGIWEYVDFAVGLMRDKEFPEHLIEIVNARYADDGAIAHMRELMDGYALDAYGLTEEQLVCMVHSPFASEGAGLEAYLHAELPQLADRAGQIRTLLDGTTEPEEPAGPLTETLERISGLSLESLCALYKSPLPRTPADGASDLIGVILEGDPHKATIETRHRPDGPVVRELISGR